MTTGGITGLLDRGKILIRVHVLGLKQPDWRPVGIYPVPGSQIVGMTRQQKTRAKYELQFWEKEAVTVSCRFILVFALFQFFRPDYLLAWNRLVGMTIRAIYTRKNKRVSFIRRVPNKTQTIPLKRHFKRQLRKDASYRRTGLRGCS